MPSFTEVAQLITAIAAVIAALASMRNSKKITDVHTAINGRMDDLLEVSKSDSFKDGVKSEAGRNAEAGRIT